MGRRGGSFARALLLARKVNFLFFPFFTFFCFFTFFIVVNLSWRRGFPNYNNEIRHLSFSPSALMKYSERERLICIFFPLSLLRHDGLSIWKVSLCVYVLLWYRLYVRPGKWILLFLADAGVTEQSIRQRPGWQENRKKNSTWLLHSIFCDVQWLYIDASPLINNTSVYIYPKLTISAQSHLKILPKTDLSILKPASP
jgi:hypothetical protein